LAVEPSGLAQQIDHPMQIGQRQHHPLHFFRFALQPL
jgi:hypothetical protein